jgi:hypothetical protein
MVGGDGGVEGSKELVGWVVTVTDGRAYTPPTHVPPRLKHSFLPVSKYCDGHCKTFLPQDVSSKSMTTWSALKIVSTMKISKHVLSLFKTCSFRYQISQNMCFDITFCTDSGRRRPALHWQKSLRCPSSSRGPSLSINNSITLLAQHYWFEQCLLWIDKARAKDKRYKEVSNSVCHWFYFN